MPSLGVRSPCIKAFDTVTFFALSILEKLKEGFSILFFVLRQRPRTSLQCFALENSLYKAKH